MTADMLMEMLLLAADANTPAEKARVAWRFNDLMWRGVTRGEVAIPDARAFNNFCQDRNTEDDWPWVDNLWSADERAVLYPQPVTEPKE